MIKAALAVVLLAAVSRACASSDAVDAGSVPNMLIGTLFKALKTGVLEMRECFGVAWLGEYKLLPTEASVGGLERLLFERSVDTPRHGSNQSILSSDSCRTVKVESQATICADASLGKRTPTDSQDASATAASGQVKTDDTLCLQRVLLKYAVFKTFLCGSLSCDERERLEAIVAANPEYGSLWAELGEFVAKLTLVKSRSDLFGTIAANWETLAVSITWIIIKSQSPDIIADLVMAYVKDSKRKKVEIPLDLFAAIAPEYQYYLATTFADLKPYYSGIEWHSLYILSRFSESPSETIRKICLAERPDYLVHEEERPPKAESPSSVEMGNFGSFVFPRDVWVTILLHLDFLSQVYVVPAVCTLWRTWHPRILVESVAAQQAFEEVLDDPDKSSLMFNLEQCPWNYFLPSRLSALKYLLCREKFSIHSGKTFNIGMNIETAWGLVEHEISGSGSSMSSESYLDLYLGCCKAANHSLELYQPFQMSDKGYVMLVRRLVEQHGIVPAVPKRFLERDCVQFVQMMKDDSELIGRLLRDDLKHYNTLILYLFSAKAHVPQEVATTLDSKSTLYRLLFGGDSSIEEYHNAIFRTSIRNHDRRMLAHSIINLVLMPGPESDRKKMLNLAIGAVNRVYRTNGLNRVMHPAVRLGTHIMEILCANRRSYSEEELGTIERALEQCGVWNGSIKRKIFERCIPKFMKDHEFVVKMV